MQRAASDLSMTMIPLHSLYVGDQRQRKSAIGDSKKYVAVLRQYSTVMARPRAPGGGNTTIFDH
jgi:hypothetical protein